MTATTTTNAVSLDMSLDQLIKHNKEMRRDRRRQRGRGNRGRGGFPRAYGGGSMGGGGPGSFRNRQMKRGGSMYSYRSNPYGAAAVPSKFTRQASEGVWRHDMFEKVTEILPPFAVRPTLGIETGTKLYISNLDYAVSTDDIKELFSEVGDVKRCSIHYDPSGRSKGTAEVVYSRKMDGIAALKRYNNVQLDGKAMKIEFVGSNLVTPTTTMTAAQSASTLQVTNGSVSKRSFYQGHDSLIQAQSNRPFGIGSGGQNRARRGFFGGRSWGYRGRGRGRGARGWGRGARGWGRGRGGSDLLGRPSTIATKSAADLDAELETYHSDAMQT